VTSYFSRASSHDWPWCNIRSDLQKRVLSTKCHAKVTWNLDSTSRSSLPQSCSRENETSWNQ